MNRLIVSIASLLLLVFMTAQTHAAITVIPQPDAEYQEATTKIDITTIPYNTWLGSITDGTLTVTFTNTRPTPPAVYTDIVPEGWATWSSPPDSESAATALLVNDDLELIMDLSIPVTTFGFELEPYTFDAIDYTVDFVFRNGPNGPTTVGTIQLSVNGRAGARLFAATTEQDLPFDRIIIRGGDYFAIAQIRYDAAVEDIDVEIDIKPGSSKNSIKLSSHSVIPVAILSNSDPSHFFDAATVVPSTVCFGAAHDPNQFGDCTQAHQAHLEDVDGDGDLDLVLYFNTLETGIRLEDTEACLTGKTFSGVFFTGCDAVQPK